MTNACVLAVLASLFVIPLAVHAYIDAGTGSYILQVAVAAFLGGLFALKVYWRKVVALLRRILGKGRGASADDG